ncbi:MAG TPA: 4Fe-4S binding protein [Corynebacteriales bacterium]|nr:4Fe-4S binding protein [Mycobacteriales bacterium]
MKMENGLEFTGYLSEKELKNCPGYPAEERLKKGPVAVIECIQKIPCNPCEDACPCKAISIGEDITDLPVLHEEKCKGCGLCISVCPGQAIRLVNQTYSENEAAIAFPFEFLPLPTSGDKVCAVNRKGEVVTTGRVLKIINSRKNDRTPVVFISIPKKWALEVVSIKLPNKKLE